MKLKSGAQPGNTNATKGKEWTDAIRYALANYENNQVKRGHALKAIARKLVEKCLDGDSGAMDKMGDRLEGKVAQIVQGFGENGAIEIIQRRIVDDKKPE
jgi:hypothetical protein